MIAGGGGDVIYLETMKEVQLDKSWDIESFVV